MPEKTSKDGNRIVSTEYETRELNADGDSIDVNHYELPDVAKANAPRFVSGGAVAVVVEKHVSKRPAHLYKQPDVYSTLATFGDEAALKAGGWK